MLRFKSSKSQDEAVTPQEEASELFAVFSLEHDVDFLL